MTASNVLAASDKGVRRAMTGCFMKFHLRHFSHDITRANVSRKSSKRTIFPTLAEHIRGNRKKAHELLN